MKKRKPKTERQKLIKKLDTVCSLITRKKGYCEWCGSKKGLQDSHIMRRNKMATRWDLCNRFCLCVACHLYRWHKEPVEAIKWAESKLGKRKINSLERKSNETVEFSIEDLQDMLKEREEILKGLED